MFAFWAVVSVELRSYKALDVFSTSGGCETTTAYHMDVGLADSRLICDEKTGELYDSIKLYML